jgi:hypothetical protein
VKQPLPEPPEILDPLGREILEGLRGHSEAASIVLGGGVALQHYCPFRPTRDLDAWWRGHPDPAARALIEQVMAAVAARFGLETNVRAWGDTQSFELLREGTKIYSFQIAIRDVQLEEPLESAWAPVRIETLRDNIGSKMSALVIRGAPRDFVDVHEVCRRGLATVHDCWRTWSRKNPGRSVAEAKVTLLRHLELIESRRPLASIDDERERRSAERLRAWARGVLAREDQDGPGR